MVWSIGSYCDGPYISIVCSDATNLITLVMTFTFYFWVSISSIHVARVWRLSRDLCTFFAYRGSYSIVRCSRSHISSTTWKMGLKCFTKSKLTAIYSSESALASSSPKYLKMFDIIRSSIYTTNVIM